MIRWRAIGGWVVFPVSSEGTRNFGGKNNCTVLYYMRTFFRDQVQLGSSLPGGVRHKGEDEQVSGGGADHDHEAKLVQEVGGQKRGRGRRPLRHICFQ